MPRVACPNPSGECATAGCTANESAIWYGKRGSKYCKPCYEKKKREAVGASPATVGGKRPRSPVEEDAGAAQIFFGADVRVSKVYKIINSRYCSPAPPFPM